MSASPHTSELNPTGEKANFRTLAGFEGFFDAIDLPDSPAKGYGELAGYFVLQLGEIADNMEATDESQLLPLAQEVKLKPDLTAKELADLARRLTFEQTHEYFNVEAPEHRIYDFEETVASEAFREALFQLLGAKVIPEDIPAKSGETITRYEGRFYDPDRVESDEEGYITGRGKYFPVIIIETRGSNSLGNYSELVVKTAPVVREYQPTLDRAPRLKEVREWQAERKAQEFRAELDRYNRGGELDIELDRHRSDRLGTLPVEQEVGMVEEVYAEIEAEKKKKAERIEPEIVYENVPDDLHEIDARGDKAEGVRWLWSETSQAAYIEITNINPDYLPEGQVLLKVPGTAAKQVYEQPYPFYIEARALEEERLRSEELAA